MWNTGNIHASILVKEPRAIHMLIYDLKKAQNFIISGINVPTQLKDKNSFPEHLLGLNNVIDVPWRLIGDFNELSKPNEKKGGQIPLSNRFK